MNIVAILANGVGSRFGSNVPKQFHKINGKMVIEYVIESILEGKKLTKLLLQQMLRQTVFILQIFVNTTILI